MTLLEESKERAARIMAARGQSRPNIFAGSFPEQVAYARDPAPFKALFCTRRASKTYSWGLEVIEDSYDWPRGNYLFLGIIREEARRMFWKEVLKDIEHKYRLGIRFNETTLTATMPNGATIYIGAADANEDEMRKLLGLRYRKVRIDEAQDWVHTDLNELIYGVLKPACADFRGSISVSGTPGKLLKGFFRQLTPKSVQAGMAGERGELPGWSLHCWDTFRNTAIGPTGRRICDEWAEEIKQLKALQPGIEETPAFRRNFLGEWVLEESDLVYRYQAGRNDFDGKLPNIDGPGRWRHVMGIDLGYEDASAFHVWAWHESSKTLYGVTSFKKSGMDVTAVARQAKAFDTLYNVEAMVIDGANKQAVAEMSNRHDMPKLQAADKTGKADFIELMNADYITGRIRLGPECAPLKDEYSSLIWDKKAFERTGKRIEHAACANHEADSALYGWRYCYQFLSQEKTPSAPVGSVEWAKQQEKAMFEAAQREVQQNKRQYQLGEFGGPVAQISEEWGAMDNDWGFGE